MNHEFVSVVITGIMPMDGDRQYQMHVAMHCACGDQHSCIYELPALIDPESAHHALKMALAGLCGAL